MNLELILQLRQKPEPFTPGEAPFWDDPRISALESLFLGLAVNLFSFAAGLFF
ncbi:MAG: hypothetical protein LDL51_13805 [Chloroflexi bacterium]|nr:hypothetical protein [Chloroflexota bacterium]